MNVCKFPGLIFYLLCASFSGGAQQWSDLSIPFYKNDTALKHALSGGLNNPQLSTFDFNFDGAEDLFVFDREGNVSLVFLNDPGEQRYVFHPEGARAFPDLNDWVLLRDYDGDGIMDIFSYPVEPGVDGVSVYKGKNLDGQIAFDRIDFTTGVHNVIYYQQSTGAYANLYVSFLDIPAIDDLDGDGDLDILSFSSLGGVINFYKNNAIESGLGQDSLHFVLADNCWGGIFESGAEICPELSEGVGQCATGFLQAPENLHSGSTLLTVDLDADQDKELILGDNSLANLSALTNNGNSNTAWMSEADCQFPSYDLSCNLVNFPAAFYLDVNFDNKKDLLAAPNNKGNTEDAACLWFWQNDTNNQNPVFNFEQDNFLVGQMVDHGTGSKPCLIDYDGDGLLDLLVGNLGKYIPAIRDPRLFLYKNTGTASQPAFTLIDEDYLNFSQYGSGFEHSLAPCSGDLDNDGDLDLLVGSNSGTLYYVENLAGAGNGLLPADVEFPYQDIDGSSLTVPQIVDLNRDGLADIVLGEANGNLNFLPNQGTITSPSFHPDIDQAPNNNFLGGVNTRLNGITGASSPLFMDFNNAFVLFCGTQDRGLVRFDDIDNNLAGNFSWTNDFRLGGFHEGTHTHVAVADLNADNRLDFVVGNDRGGLRIFSSNINTSGMTIAVSSHVIDNTIKVYPNPTTDFIHIESTDNNYNDFEFAIYNSNGNKITNQKITAATRYTLKHLPSGMYMLVIHKNKKRFLEKILLLNNN